MKTTERIIRDKHTRIPDKYKKIDTTVKGMRKALPKNTRKWRGNCFLYALTRPPLFTSQKTSKTKHMLQKHVNGWG